MLKNQHSLVGNFLTMIKYTKSNVRDYLIKQLPSATAFINTEYEVVQASDQWIDTFAFSAPEVLGATLFELYGKISESWCPIFDSSFKGHRNSQPIDSFIHQKGKEVHIQWQCLPWYDEDENIIGAIIHNQETSKGIANEQKLEKLGAFLKEKSKTAKIGSWEMDFSGEIWWCPMTKKIHGVPLDYTPNHDTALSFFKKPCRKKIMDAIKLAIEKGSPWSDRFQIVTPDGEEKWVICSGNPLYKKGKLPSIIGTYRDVTKIIEEEAKTRKNEQLLQTLINHLPINVFIKDKEGKKILANKHELEFYGLTKESQMLGKDDSHFIKGDYLKSCQDDDKYVIEGGKSILGKENIVVKNDGQEITFLTSKIPLRDEYDNVIGLVGFSLDISDLKTKEEELKKLINISSLQNKKLVDFAHIISHNLRSHAANFSMLAEFLLTEKNKDEQRKITQMLVTASDGLLETLDNLNEGVVISTNVNITKKPINLSNALAFIIAEEADLIHENNGTIINNINKDLIIHAKPEYLENILTNFITNGIKYRSPKRNPVIKFSAICKNNYTVLTIEDNGIGIDLDKHGDKLFGMYKIFHNNEDAKGIGLFFTKKQIEAMNGKVTVKSKVGVGTTFKIYFNG